MGSDFELGRGGSKPVEPSSRENPDPSNAAVLCCWVGYHPPMKLVDVLADLLNQANDGPPTAEMLEAHLAPRATEVTRAGPHHNKPSWATTVGSANDVYVTLGGDVLGVYLHEDPRGWGAYATLHLGRGTLAEVEALLGEGSVAPRRPDDFYSGQSTTFYLPRGGKTVRVFVELQRSSKTDIDNIMIHFQR